MRNLRWAAELAISGDDAKALLGISQLRTLSASNLSDSEVQAFVDAALDAVVGPLADEIEQDSDVGGQSDLAAEGRAGDASEDAPPVHSPRMGQQEGEGDG